MPSIEESKRQVKAGLEGLHQDFDHDAILAGMRSEIDSHNETIHSHDDRGRHSKHQRQGVGSGSDASARSQKFHFKAGVSDPNMHSTRKRKHRSKHDSSHRHRKHSRRMSDERHDGEAAHPFPREPTNLNQTERVDSTAAFRESLFDALADDEGAAYWESVYNQPIHIYARPTVETAKGELENMNDDQYAAYVQTKMWEKTHPHLVQEREKSKKKRREEEEETARKREDFVRRKERAAWERAQEHGARRFAGMEDDNPDDYEYVFDHEGRTAGASRRESAGGGHEDYRDAWSKYLAAWDKLRTDPNGADGKDVSARLKPADDLPWPVMPSKSIVRSNIEAFMQHVPLHDQQTRLQGLKLERVRWHPDKIQQRFGGKVDEATMKIVTSIFQVVDVLVENERNRVG